MKTVSVEMLRAIESCPNLEAAFQKTGTGKKQVECLNPDCLMKASKGRTGMVLNFEGPATRDDIPCTDTVLSEEDRYLGKDSEDLL